jgi:hypothetical protein
MTRHKYADLIIAWANGAKIQFNWTPGRDHQWFDFPSATTSSAGAWYPECQYRIKPEPKPDVVGYAPALYNYTVFKGKMEAEDWLHTALKNGRINAALIKCVWDGETGKLKSVEIVE